MNVTGTVDKDQPAAAPPGSKCVKEIIQAYPKQLSTKVSLTAAATPPLSSS